MISPHALLTRQVTMLLVLTVLTGCTTIYPEPKSAAQITGDSVIVTGRIELVPPLRQGEQQLTIGADPTDAKGKVLGRALLYLSDDPAAIGERTGSLINPPLGKTFFFAIPRSQRYVTYGTILMSVRVDIQSRRTVSQRTTELLLPPALLDLKGSDRAVYIGTLRLYRDEFNDVYKQEVIDQYAEGEREFRSRFGPLLPLRKALMDVSRTRRSGSEAKH